MLSKHSTTELYPSGLHYFNHPVFSFSASLPFVHGLYGWSLQIVSQVYPLRLCIFAEKKSYVDANSYSTNLWLMMSKHLD
jgi:hypothetical protein